MLYEIINPFKNINWDNPVVFLFIIFLILLYKRKWKTLIISTSTIVTAWLTSDFIIKNITSSEIVIAVPHLVYYAGGIIIVLIAVIGFTKFIIE
jgi:hypothetical protein